MRRYLPLVLAMLLMSGLLPSQAAPTAAYAPNELLVKYTGTVKSAQVTSAHARVGATVLTSYAYIPWQRVKLPAGMTVPQGIAKYKGLPGVLAVEPNFRVQAAASPRPAVAPNDPRLSALWGMTKINAQAAWNTSTGSRTVVVAVVDTGVDYTHEDLAANSWTNPHEIAGNGIDDDNNGYVDDVHGINSITGSGNPMDDNDHGSHCAGTIGGVGNNGLGVVGVNWQVSIMGCKFLAADGYGDSANALECYQYILAMKQRGVNIRVVNNSWGGGGFSQAMEDAFNAAGAAGIVSCCAAGQRRERRHRRQQRQRGLLPLQLQRRLHHRRGRQRQ